MRGDLEFGTIPGLVTVAAERHGDRPAIEDGDTTLSFRGLAAATARAAAGLQRLGIGHGDRVAIWAPNMWEWVVAALGIHSVGAVLVPINTRYKEAEARFILDKAKVKLVFTVDGYRGLDLAGMLGEASRPVVVFRGPSWDALMAGEAAATSPVQPHDLSDILFTSGTTGHPKGVMCTHAQTLRVFRDWAEVVGLRADDRYLVVAPFFHCFGYKAGWLACLMTGATILPQPVFDLEQVLTRIPRDRVTMLPGPPALYQTLLQRDPGVHDLSSLRLAVTGAAVIPVSLIQRMRTELGFESVITGYGLTEACGVATMCRFDDDPETIATTSGRAIPNVEVQVVDADGNPVAPGQAGEIRVRGYNVMLGYLDEPEQTAEAIREGWLHTGDIGVMDARGYLRITDRLKDMFIVGGFNTYPAEIEQRLADHPGVRACAVVGVPDPRLGEVGCAFIEGDVPEAELIAWARDHMANFKVPRRVIHVAALPRTASGKIQKFTLRAWAAAG